MSTLKQHAKSLATTAADYRKDELDPFTAEHVMAWVDQFDEEDQLPMLAELDHVLKKTYFSEARVTKFLSRLVKNPKLTGDDPVKFWKSAGVLDIQQGGSSQTELLERFNAVLQEQIGIDIQECEASTGNFIYLDDATFLLQAHSPRGIGFDSFRRGRGVSMGRGVEYGGEDVFGKGEK